jgi:CheY-like chemotaxis protein
MINPGDGRPTIPDVPLPLSNFLRIVGEDESMLNEHEIQNSSNNRRQRILVIEDNRDSAETLCLLLQCCGYEADAVYSGPDGVKEAEQYQPDVVICDIGLPGLNGYEVARKLRANPATAKIRLVALTAYNEAEHRRRSYEAGFEHHFVKPVNPDALQRVLNSHGRNDHQSGEDG